MKQYFTSYIKLGTTYLYVCIAFLVINVSCMGETSSRINLGIDVLIENNYSILKGKRIGLLTHTAGVNKQGMSTIELLRKIPEVHLVALFAPEHGLDSSQKAFEFINNSYYQKTNIPIYSLHGKYRKPTADMLKDIDALVVDLQDIGVRSYTYISCLKLCMEACFDNGKTVVILDRPNPLGGLKVDGPIIDESYMGYIGAYPIPYVYGLTIAELAIMAIKEKWLNLEFPNNPKKLIVVPMKGWKRSMLWPDTGLDWVSTSPNIPSFSAVLGYAIAGLGCQIGGFSHGIQTTYPFRFLTSKHISATRLLYHLNALKIHGLEFKKMQAKTKKSGIVEGVYIKVMDWESLRPTMLSFYLMRLACQIQANPFKKSSNKDKTMFNKHTGSFELWNALVKDGSRVALDVFFKKWNTQNNVFKNKSKRYYLYD